MDSWCTANVFNLILLIQCVQLRKLRLHICDIYTFLYACYPYIKCFKIIIILGTEKVQFLTIGIDNRIGIEVKFIRVENFKNISSQMLDTLFKWTLAVLHIKAELEKACKPAVKMNRVELRGWKAIFLRIFIRQLLAKSKL